MKFHFWPCGGAHVPPLTFHPGGGVSAKRLFFGFLSLCLSGLRSPVWFHQFFRDSAVCSCNIREEGALYASGERVHRLCVTILNNAESLPSLSLECPVLTQKNDSPLSVGSLHREASVGKYQRSPFRKQALIKSHWKGWRGTLSVFFGMHLSAPS